MTKKQIELIQDLILFTKDNDIRSEESQTLVTYVAKQLKEEIAKSLNRKVKRSKQK